MTAPIRIALLVDDGAPVNVMFFHDPPYEHPLLMPNGLARDFADLCDRYGVRGKFSVLPMPCCLGDINGRLNHVPQRHLSGFLKIMRERVAPRFDITPEILTHLAAYRLNGGFQHRYEDEWIAQATAEEITDYIALALEILNDVGLPATGVTSPWTAGDRNEETYARAIAAAQWRVHRRKVSWYFLHMLGSGPARSPSVSYRNPETGQVVVSIPSATFDPFWDTQRPAATTRRHAHAVAKAGVDGLLGANGKTGRIPAVIRQNCPVTILTHWQSLYSDGTFAGLRGLEKLLARLHARYAGDLEWITCSELAAQAEGCSARSFG